MASFQAADFVRNVMENSERPLIGGPVPEGTIGLSSGDPDFRTPEHVREAMIAAVRQGYSNYPPGNGDPELLSALANLLKRRYGVDWSPNDITVTNGGGGALYSSIGAFLNPGDTVLVPQPTFSSYRDVAMLHGAEVVWVPLDNEWHLDLDALREAARASNAKMMIICNPNNPTGVVYNREELEGAARIAQEFNLLVLADEVYDHLILDDIPFVSTMEIEGFRDRLLYCNSFSKTFAMTGWRMGWVAASPGLIGAVSRVARSTGGGVNWAMQRAGIAAITGPMEPTEAMRLEYAARRDLIDELLEGAEGISWVRPQGAFYAFLKYDADIPAREMTSRLRDRGVLLRSGTEYGPGGEGYVRVAFATDRDSLTEGMLRVRSTLLEAIQGRRKVGVS
ncbi:MAG TPA: aminotransferase class I/II-fold pyridoxal phosphate-dependent enzyme [Thermomicrobiales bacterium]|nr:aminotransferase class I/II-fold pyridoxal phosphate-dependent enzyme [Thermomicrobiales bacterium]